MVGSGGTAQVERAMPWPLLSVGQLPLNHHCKPGTEKSCPFLEAGNKSHTSFQLLPAISLRQGSVLHQIQTRSWQTSFGIRPIQSELKSPIYFKGQGQHLQKALPSGKLTVQRQQRKTHPNQLSLGGC